MPSRGKSLRSGWPLKPSQVRMRSRFGWPGEADAEHVPDLALHPVGGLPHGRRRGDLDAVRDPHLEAQAPLVAVAVHPPDDVEAALGTVLPVDRGAVHQVVVAEPLGARPEHLQRPLGGDHHRDLTGQLDRLQHGLGHGRGQLRHLRVPPRILRRRGDGVGLPGRQRDRRSLRCRGFLLCHQIPLFEATGRSAGPRTPDPGPRPEASAMSAPARAYSALRAMVVRSIFFCSCIRP